LLTIYNEYFPERETITFENDEKVEMNSIRS